MKNEQEKTNLEIKLEQEIELAQYRIDQLETWQDHFNDELKINGKLISHLTGLVLFLSIMFLQSLRYTEMPLVMIIPIALFIALGFWRTLASL